jgi:hypothetical protein
MYDTWTVNVRGVHGLASMLQHAAETLLLRACSLGHTATALAIIQGGVDTNVLSHAGYTPLMLACMHGGVAVVEALLMAGSNVRLTAPNGDTAVHIALRHQHEAVVIAIFELVPLEVCQQLSAGFEKRNLLHLSTRNGFLSCTEHLIWNVRVPLDEVDEDGRTAVHLAVHAKAPEILQSLLDAGADANLIDHAGFSPLILAVTLRYRKCAQLLERAALNVGGRIRQAPIDGDSSQRSLTMSQLVHSKRSHASNAAALVMTMSGKSPMHAASCPAITPRPATSLARRPSETQRLRNASLRHSLCDLDDIIRQELQSL